MSVSGRLIYVPGDLESSASVAAGVMSGDDLTAIGHVSDALKVNFTNSSLAVTATDLDIRNLDFNNDSVTAYQGTSPWVIGDGGGSITVDGTVAATQSGSWTVAATQSGSWTVGVSGTVSVSATDLDIRDLSHSQDSIKIGDGTDFLGINNDGSINVNISGGFTDIDDSLANVAMACQARAVSTSAINLLSGSALSNRKWLFVANEGDKSLYLLPPAGGTAADGFPIHPGDKHEFRIGAAVMPKVIGKTGASNEDLRVMELS